MKACILLLAIVAGCNQRDLADCPSASAACGDDTDATTADGPSQAGTITVRVLDDRGLPALGVRVIATLSADGSAISEATTLADGIAVFEVAGDIDITTVVTTGLGSRMTTIRNVSPPTEVVFGRRRNEPPSVMRTITWNTDPSAAGYELLTSCSNRRVLAAQSGVTTQSITIPLDPTCASDFDVMVIYTDAARQNAFQFKLSNTGDVVLDGVFTPFTQLDGNFTQRPADVANGNLFFFGVSIFRSTGVASGPVSLGTIAGGAGGAASVLSLPVTGTVGRELSLTLGHDPDASQRFQQIVERVPPQDTYTLDIEPHLLPWITSNATVDLGARTVTWTQLSAGPAARTAGDLIAAEINYTRDSLVFTWRIVMPSTAAVPTGNTDEFRLPLIDLPGAEPFEPLPTDTLDTKQHLRFYAFTAASGLPVEYAVVARIADLAISNEFDARASDQFLLTGLVDVDLSRMVLSLNTP